MRTSEPALLPLFRSQTQLDVVAALYRAPEEMTVTELAEMIDAPVSTVSREVARLAEAGLVEVRSLRRSKLVRARRDFSWAPALAEILDRTVGITATLERHLARVDGIDEAFVFGSWAARRHGRLGPPPKDLDVLVVGAPSAFALAAARQAIESETGLSIDVVVVSPDRFADPADDTVLADIVAGPLVDLELDGG